MSSTNRSNERKAHGADYYVTPKEPIKAAFDFLFGNLEGFKPARGFDPAAGGNKETMTMHPYGMPYPEEMKERGVQSVWTMDIRKDSLADFKEDFLNDEEMEMFGKFDLIATNPPFNLAEGFIRKSIGMLNDGGVMMMLLRLNFLGGQKRKALFDEFMPDYVLVHRKRICFNTNMKYLKRQTDSIEYAHFVWFQKNIGKEKDCIIKILD